MHAHIVFLGAAIALGLVPAARPGPAVRQQWVGEYVVPFYAHAPPDIAPLPAVDGEMGAAHIFDAVVAKVSELLSAGPAVFDVCDARGAWVGASGESEEGDGAAAATAVPENAAFAGANEASLTAFRAVVGAATEAGTGDMVVLFDFDGTLYEEASGEAYERTCAYMARLHGRGVPVAVLTGRVQAELGAVYRTLAPFGLHVVPVFARVSSRQAAVAFKTAVVEGLVSAGVLDGGSTWVMQLEDQVGVGAGLYGTAFGAVPVATIIVDQGARSCVHYTPDMSCGAGGSGVVRAMVPGEPGVGKSVLLEAVAAAVGEDERVAVALLSNDMIASEYGAGAMSFELKRQSREAVERGAAEGKTAVVVYDNRGASNLVTDASWVVVTFGTTEAEFEVMDMLGYVGVLNRPGHGLNPLDLDAVVREPSRERWAAYAKAVQRLHAKIRDSKYAHGAKVTAAAQAAGAAVEHLSLLDVDAVTEADVLAVATLKDVFSGRKKNNPWARTSWNEQLEAVVGATEALATLHARVIRPTAVADVSAAILAHVGGPSAVAGREMAKWRYVGLTLPGFAAVVGAWWEAARERGMLDGVAQELVAAVAARAAAPPRTRPLGGYHVTLAYKRAWTAGEVWALQPLVEHAVEHGAEVSGVRLVANAQVACLEVALDDAWTAAVGASAVADAQRVLHVTLGVAGGGEARDANALLASVADGRASDGVVVVDLQPGDVAGWGEYVVVQSFA